MEIGEGEKRGRVNMVIDLVQEANRKEDRKYKGPHCRPEQGPAVHSLLTWPKTPARWARIRPNSLVEGVCVSRNLAQALDVLAGLGT